MTPPWHPILMWDTLSILKNIWKFWSMSGHPFHSMAGHFFKKCSKFCQKMPKNRSWYTSWEKILFRVGATQKKIIQNIFLCLYYLIITGLPAKIISGHWWARFRCYVEFAVWAKTDSSYENECIPFYRVSTCFMSL